MSLFNVKLKYVVFYSVEGGVGKTTLSISFAVEKKRVIAVDADWTRPELAAYFNTPKKIADWLMIVADGHPAQYWPHRPEPGIFVVPNYVAVKLYHYRGGEYLDLIADSLMEFLTMLPQLVSDFNLAVDTVVVDMTNAPPLTLVERLARDLGALMVFVIDRRSLMNVAEQRAEAVRNYAQYASLIVANMTEKGDEKLPSARIVNAMLRMAKRPARIETYKDVYRMLTSVKENEKALKFLVSKVVERL